MLLDEGMVFLADSRTNAGVDQIATFRKASIFAKPGERVMVLMSSGNLAITQNLVATLREDIGAGDERPSIFNAPDMFEAARRIGAALRELHKRDAEPLKSCGIDFNAALIFGGQIAGEAPRLFYIYAAGNFIEATTETPYFQIGEAKYGKPIIDRVLRTSTTLGEAAKCALISMDSTIRSNLSVGLPLDLVVIRRDALSIASHQWIDSSNDYLNMLQNRWGEALRKAFSELPDPPF